MNRLDHAIKLAVEIHEGQVDKGGNHYILHPLRVMTAVEKDLRNSGNVDRIEDFICAAICHDIAEDYDREVYDWPEVNRRLHQIGDFAYIAVNALTRREGQSWKDYINKVYENDIARFVKIRDLRDNCDLSRIKEVTDEDIKRNNMYIKAMNFLETREGKL